MAKRGKKPNMQRRSGEKRPKLADAVDAFVAANMETLAVLAWVGFQQEGRGFVLVAIEQDGGLDASYIGERDELWAELKPAFPELEALIASYNPPTQIALVRRVPDLTEMGVVTPDVPPPVAHRQYDGDHF